MKRIIIVDFPTLIRCGWIVEPVALTDIIVTRPIPEAVPEGIIDPQRWKPAVYVLSPERNRHLATETDITCVTSVTALSMAEAFIETELKDFEIVDISQEEYDKL